MSGTNDRASLLAASVKHHLYSRYLKYEAAILSILKYILSERSLWRKDMITFDINQLKEKRFGLTS
jgi:hypothetical protein